MHPDQLHQILAQVARKTLSVEAAMSRLRHWPFAELGFAKVDHHRHMRQGFPEVIFGEGKSPAQLVAIARELYRRSGLVLITRVSPEAVRALRRLRLPVRVHGQARCAVLSKAGHPPAEKGCVVVATAGTADIPVAAEAALTARWMGARVETLFDVGVAGLHRLLAHHDLLAQARCLVVAAGMEGALASVAGGLVSCPVVAVPTSIGYGAALGGIAPLLTMLNSCTPNVAVVNIDNGFGAGYCAALINRIGS